MALRNLFSKKQPAVAATSTTDATDVNNKETQPPVGVAGSDSNNGVDSDEPAVLREEDVVCPPHTTEGKLMWKIDCHVVPWLCLMYLLAFLGKLSFSCAQSHSS